MKVSEFHFNPEAEETKVFETFVYEPKTADERKQGYLYMAGCLTNLLPQNNKLLDSLAGVIKEEYYGRQANLKESLEKANGFLAGEVKKENVSWLGNLNFAILSLSAENSEQDSQELNFTKTGNIKMMLVRDNEIVDISSNLEAESSSSKIFKNVSSGKLLSGDKIIVLSKGIFEFLMARSLIKRIAFSHTEKELKQVFNSFRKELAKISGFCFFIILQRSRIRLPFLKPLDIRKPKLGFVLTPFKSIGRLFFWLLHFKKPRLSNPLAKIRFTNPFSRMKNWILGINWRHKNLFLLFLLILVMVIGFLIFSPEKERELAQIEQTFTEAKAKVIEAEDFLASGKEKEASLLLQEIYEELLTLEILRIPLQEDIKVLKNSVEESLFFLNKLDVDPNIELLFEFNSSEFDFVPQRTMAFDSELYFYNPFSSQLYWFDAAEKNSQFVKANQSLKLGTAADTILLFTTPNILYSFHENEFSEIELELPYVDFSFDLMAEFKNSLYFLDKNSGEIARYPKEGKSAPILWLQDDVERQVYHGSASMAIDGSIWVLNDNEINRYHGGRLQEVFKIDTFPVLQNPTKIWTSSSHLYIYLLEPSKNRIIVLSRQGEIVKQFQSEEFNNLKDFSVSADGQTIYLLNGVKIYKIIDNF
ncbi:hypothetical protein KAR26_03620 [Candidatus Parcubacteria bacterium]|nr:hypothetical protein [Candidatus Parcubacteria bacterium]